MGVRPKFSPRIVIFVPAVASFGEIPVTTGGGPIFEDEKDNNFSFCFETRLDNQGNKNFDVPRLIRS